MNLQKTPVIPVILVFCSFLLTCGIGEVPYLPQVPESGITTITNTEAEITISSNLLNSTDYSYASGYIIFYKIYVSNIDSDTLSNILSSNQGTSLSSDYSSLFNYTDPANLTSITSLNTFSNLKFYELELEGVGNIRDNILSTSGGTYKIIFPTRAGEEPYFEFNGNKYKLLRSNGGGTFSPKPENRYFFNSDDLRKYENATTLINADVAGQNGSYQYAYTSMYIVAVGQDPSTFSRLYGKPTHISIFKLTQSN